MTATADPLDGRDGVMEPRPFALPCRHEQIIERLVRALATDRGQSLAFVRLAFGITAGGDDRGVPDG